MNRNGCRCGAQSSQSWWLELGLCVFKSNNDWNAQRYVPTFQDLPLLVNAPNNNSWPKIGC